MIERGVLLEDATGQDTVRIRLEDGTVITADNSIRGVTGNPQLVCGGHYGAEGTECIVGVLKIGHRLIQVRAPKLSELDATLRATPHILRH